MSEPNSHRPDSVDYLLASVKARGLRLANLFEFETPAGQWRWQANVTDGARFWEFGRGETPQAALRAALFTSATEEGTLAPKRAPSAPILSPARHQTPAEIPRTSSSKLRI